MREPDKLIPTHGGYRSLKSFQVAQLAYDVTVRFCDKFIDRRSRTHDQMVQAARSGVQNIAEGSQASGTSKKTELKLTNVARASLEELRLDYEDFLRQRGLPLWPRDDPRRSALIACRPVTADDVARWALELSHSPVPSTSSTRSVASTPAYLLYRSFRFGGSGQKREAENNPKRRCGQSDPPAQSAGGVQTVKLIGLFQ